MTTPTNEAGHGLPELPALPSLECGPHTGHLAIHTEDQIRRYAEGYGRACYALALSRGVPDGTWLWCKLMDWCRKQGVAPANFDSLFAIASEAHKLYAAPAAAGAQGEVEAASDGACPAGVECFKANPEFYRCIKEARHYEPQPAAADGGVRERARELLADAQQRADGHGVNARLILDEGMSLRCNVACDVALHAVSAALSSHRQAGDEDREDEDHHVIMKMGRLLAEIALLLKGAEPAGTLWGYHDLPEILRNTLNATREISDEMRAWANIKMAEPGSSRRDRLMVSEWGKRLVGEDKLPFPVKDFSIPGTSLSKEEIRDAVRTVMQQREIVGQDFGETAPPLSKFRELAERWREAQKRAETDGVNAKTYAGAKSFDYESLAYRECADELLALVEKGAGS